ncbi:hypothetical protein Sjap_013137 [Stephania japonica]|uniref:Protein kinase domain-containing protein n=1 Tax=Stephania japonica TaxID=461633 RepID=A0AAP0NZK8_9MAGN
MIRNGGDGNLINPASAHNASVDPDLVKYSGGESIAVAPKMVYATAREMADANVVGEHNFNISWLFDVDQGFSYLIRLHFCDTVSRTFSSMVFNVFVNNQTAMDAFDISSKAKALGTAYFIMKISDHDHGLDAIHRTDYNGSKTTTKKKLPILPIACSAAVASVLLIVIILVVFLHFQHSKKPPPLQPLAWQPLPTHMSNSITEVSTASLASPVPSLAFGRILTLGVLENGDVVAVKRGNARCQQGLVQFMAGEPLRKHLYGSDLLSLAWKQRLEICIGAAKGLHYLHTGAAECIIHPDVKTANILLEKNLKGSLAEWALKWQKKDQLEYIIDPHLAGTVNLESLHKFGETAEKCLQEHGIDRSTMGDILWNLEHALQLQEPSLQSAAEENSMNNIPDWIPQVKHVNNDAADIARDQFSNAETTSGVFSQLMNPQGR